ncbi:MAG: hypothetical protein ACOY8P_06540 [Thermodesulfobacteriota bacterium]
MAIWGYIALTLLVLVIAATIIAVWRSGAKKAIGLALARRVALECCASSQKSGSFTADVGDIDQGLLDIATQGFSLTIIEIVVAWRKDNKRCFFTLQVTGKDSDGASGTVQSPEFVVPCEGGEMARTDEMPMPGDDECNTKSECPYDAWHEGSRACVLRKGHFRAHKCVREHEWRD